MTQDDAAPIVVAKVADKETLATVKALADQHRRELGFHSRESYTESAREGELLAATEARRVLGYIRFHHRRDLRTSLYEIAVDFRHRNRGIGWALVNALINDCRGTGSRSIRLLCPVELPANRFYEQFGFVRTPRSRKGKDRPLYEWKYAVLPARPITFVAALTASTNDLKLMVEMWEAEGPRQKPFERCIITPLFIDPGAYQSVRRMHDLWGVEVVFDSGGFFVQQGKIGYHELFTRLLAFYAKNDWAEGYVLPDFPPTSRQRDDEVTERVYVTAAEGVKFFKRLPPQLQPRAIGTLQGRTPTHLRHCYDAFQRNGIQRLAFGSFDTTGVNAEINILTDGAIGRLAFLRDLIKYEYVANRLATMPDLHFFGVSSPMTMASFGGFLATSYDSSGWLRTAGFGNVYLPFQSRRNISHGSTALRLGNGLSTADFYAGCEETGHSCPFCRNFARLKKDRFARMWHNALVFTEMTDAVNNREARFTERQ
ncbi:MAG: GNAT family N-acetyltransferase [Nitrospiraceae bacterium]|nr:GNAT family N-acetyltransferase [Nitrospiraceae bacterium]